MKVRIGFGLGTRSLTNDGDRLDELLDGLETHGFDSLWLSERIGGESPDPVVGMAYAAGRTRKLKFGTSVMVLPGRNPVLVAKALATLDRLSNGRLLPAFGLGIADRREHQAFGVERGERAGWFDEALPLIRRLWAEETVTHHGDRFHLDGIAVRPKPVQQPVDVWLGGRAPAELRRVGRLGDGWLPSFCIPDDVRGGRKVIEEAADEAGRAIDPEHYGALVPYVREGDVPDLIRQAVATRRPGVDAAEVVPSGFEALARHLERFVDAGASKFVVVPVQEPGDWGPELEQLAAAVLPLQT